jgi:protein-tyrosine phosphatase
MIDIHTHVLPGVDDGCRTIEQSLDILRGLADQGITDVICTPHYINETPQTSPRSYNVKQLSELRAAALEIGINLYIGNEIYIDRDIQKLLKNHRISSLADSKYLLVELPMTGEFPDYEDILINLKHKGWQVILAHPERYETIQSNPTIAKELHGQGILLQCNLGSLVGQYGKEAQKTIKQLAKEKIIFCFGTDVHRPRDYSQYGKAIRKLYKFYSGTELNTILVENPSKIVK